METQNPVITETDATEYSGRATYEPESNVLRLYVGRVPRDEYLKLRAEGWRALHKQREAGGGDFVATWTPDRRDTAIEYAGVIEDEDMSVSERAADRAERFAGYREKRTAEATGRADQFDAGPTAHGFQSQARADRAVRRHDRIAGRACDAWSKAEYWQSRTAGVIAHRLHLSSPEVRMGRIKELESEIRKSEKSRAEYVETWQRWQECAAMTDAAEQTKRAEFLAGFLHSYDYKHPRPDEVINSHVREKGSSLCTLLDLERNEYGKSITGAEACAMFFARHRAPAGEGDWLTHYRLRLAYETQMLEAQGGRAGVVEMEVGGTFRGRVIVRIHKSNASGRVTSVDFLRPKIQGTGWEARSNVPGTEYAIGCYKTERADPDAYAPPTDESRATLAAFEAAKKAATAKRKETVPTIPLVNPTDADAERLQTIWNARSALESSDRSPREVLRTTQAIYSANSGFRTETIELTGGGFRLRHSGGMDRPDCPVVAKVRACGGRVVVLTDKPQKAFAANVWHDPRPGIIEELAADFERLEKAVCANYYDRTAEQTALFYKARIVGLTYCDSTSQYGWSRIGDAWAKQQRAKAPAFALVAE